MTKSTLPPIHRVTNLGLLALGLSPFVYWVLLKSGMDAWWDEILSLKEYALVSMDKTMTTYPDPNNHIFSNLVNNAATKLIGATDIYNLLDHLSILRLIQALFALVTLFYSFLTVRLLSGKKYAFLAVVLLATCIPFLNFSLQLRGYNLSMLFMIMTIYHAWAYVDHRKSLDLVVFALSVFLLLYTVPSNAYALLAFGLVVGWEWLRKQSKTSNANRSTSRKKKRRSKKEKPKWTHQQYLFLGLACAIALSLVYMAYIPVMESLLHNRFVDNTPPSRAFVLTDRLPNVLFYFLSQRWLLVAMLLAGIVLIWKHGRDVPYAFRLFGLWLVLLLPFVFAFIHHKHPFERTFIVLAPVFAVILSLTIIGFIEQFRMAEVFAVILSLTIIGFIEQFRMTERGKTILVALTCIYAIGTAFWQLQANEAILMTNLETEKREQTIYRNYYLSASFTPSASAKALHAQNASNATAILMDNLDRVSYSHYLEKNNVRCYAIAKSDHKKLQIKDRTFNHVLLVQKTVGRDKKPLFMNIPCNIPEKGEFNAYAVMMSGILQAKEDRDYYAISAYPEKINRADKQLSGLEFSLVDSSTSTLIYDVEFNTARR